MKKQITTWLLILLMSGMARAELPLDDKIYIKQHWLSMTTSYDIATKTQKLGTLYRRFLSLLLKYDFYDPFDKKIATAKSRFFSFSAHFDIYDTDNHLLGAANESLFAFFPTFDIYAEDGVTKLAKAKMNFWGTVFYIYDPLTNEQMAQLSRSFFRVKNDWTFQVTNKPLFEQKQIDKRVLVTVVAFQGDREYWQSQQNESVALKHNNTKLVDPSLKNLNRQRTKVNQQITQRNHLKPNAYDRIAMQAMIKKLDKAYLKEQRQQKHAQLSHSEQVAAFVDFALNYAKTKQRAESKRQLIYHLLKLRLNN